MPLFYFHLNTPLGLDPDEIGLEYPTLDEAYLETCRTIPGMAAEFMSAGRNPMEYAFEIASEDGAPVMEVPFDEMLRDAHGPRRPASRGAAMRLESAAERAQQLTASVREQVAALQENMRCAQAILEQAHGGARAASGMVDRTASD